MSARLRAVATVAAVVAVAMLGYRHGETAGARAAASPAVAVSMARKTPPRPPKRAATSDGLPSDLWSLDGSEFVAKMPALEKLARSGDLAAERVLVNRLQRCSTYQHRGEDDIRRSVDEQYAQQLGVQKNIEASGGHSTFRIDDKWRDDLLRRDLDERDRCEALGAADLDRRFDWAALALSHHDRDTTLRFATMAELEPNDAERLRDADRLPDIAHELVAELDALVDSGDADAMEREAYLFSNPSHTILDVADPVRGYALAYAMSLAAASGDGSLTRLAGARLQEAASRLSPNAIEQAQRDGEALYERCCRNGFAPH